MLERGIGGAARVVTVVTAMLLTFGTMNAYLAGAARLGAALARDGMLPSALAKGHRPGETPRRSLLLLCGLSVAVCVLAVVTDTELRPSCWTRSASAQTPDEEPQRAV